MSVNPTVLGQKPGATQTDLAAFFEAAERIVGRKNVATESEELQSLGLSMSAERRSLPGCVYPTSTEEVRELVLAANRTGTSVYPISTGKNWGLGSGLPVRNGVVILNLSRMTRIRELNLEYGYAVVEPGVTQQQLADRLAREGSPYMLDVTGSSASTSILGNVLEGGLPYFGLREKQAHGFEVVLGSGEMAPCGFDHFPASPLAHLSGNVVGPRLDGLFIQSNYGIVTAVTLDLIRRAEHSETAVCGLTDESRLDEFIDRIGTLQREGQVPVNVKIGDRQRGTGTLGPLVLKRLRASQPGATREQVEKLLNTQMGPWSAAFPVTGSRGHVRELKRAVRRTMGGVSRTRFVSIARLKKLQRALGVLKRVGLCRNEEAFACALEPLIGLTEGIPTEQTLPSLYWPHGELPEEMTAPDSAPAVGMSVYTPLIPLEGKLAASTVGRIREIAAGYAFVPSISLTAVAGRSLWGVVDILFDRRRPEQRRQAADCVRELDESLLERGIVPQRVGIDRMDVLVREGDLYWDAVRKLKEALDPNGVIAPGRYNLV